MSSKSDSTMEVRFPASDTFDQLGRISAAAIALRLNYKVRTVDRLRSAVDIAVEALGPKGTIKLLADWGKGPLQVRISNPKAKIAKTETAELQRELAELVTELSIKTTSISFVVGS